jgi:hypothetical protein
VSLLAYMTPFGVSSDAHFHLLDCGADGLDLYMAFLSLGAYVGRKGINEREVILHRIDVTTAEDDISSGHVRVRPNPVACCVWGVKSLIEPTLATSFNRYPRIAAA